MKGDMMKAWAEARRNGEKISLADFAKRWKKQKVIPNENNNPID